MSDEQKQEGGNIEDANANAEADAVANDEATKEGQPDVAEDVPLA